MTTVIVPLHPERTADPMTLRWRVRHTMEDTPDRAGETAPSSTETTEDGDPATAPLSSLVGSGVLAAVRIGRDHIATTLAEGRSWSIDGATVRVAVQEAIRQHDLRMASAGSTDRDILLGRVAQQVISEMVTPIAGAHGGAVEFVRASGGVVTVRMKGACHGCPASSATLYGRLERELHRRLPWSCAVVVA